MSFVCLLNLLGQFMPTTTVQDAGDGVVRLLHGKSDNEPYTVGSMFGEYRSLCTLNTSIVDFGKEKEHCRAMSFVCLFNLLGQSMPTTTVQDANSIRGMSRCTRYVINIC
jgi:hypothetical protein